MRRIPFRALVLALVAPAAGVFAGPIAPPAGPVAPTMKTLQQVEPRTPISAATTPGDASSVYKITQSGSYYLTGDVIGVAGKSGIEIDADDVTIDLNGFALRGVPGAHSGIIDRDDETLTAVRHVVVRNGVIEAWPRCGVMLSLTDGGRVTDLLVSGNGTGLYTVGAFLIRNVRASHNTWPGIETEGDAIVTQCAASHNDAGLRGSGGVFEACVARYNRNTGFSVGYATLRGCTAESNTEVGVEATRSIVADCLISGGKVGVKAGYSATVEGCVIHGASSCGISVQHNNTRIVGNRITSSGGSSAPNAAIHVPQFYQNAHIEGNSGVDNARGVSVEGTGCLVLRNSFGRPVQNHINYVIAAGNRIAPIVHAGTNATLVSTPGTSAYSGSFTTTDPNANIAY